MIMMIFVVVVVVVVVVVFVVVVVVVVVMMMMVTIYDQVYWCPTTDGTTTEWDPKSDRFPSTFMMTKATGCPKKNVP